MIQHPRGARSTTPAPPGVPFAGYAIGSPPLKVWALIGMGFGAFGSLVVLMRALRRYQREALAGS